MEPTRFDHISKVFAERRLSRRRALAAGGSGTVAMGLAAALQGGAALDATPGATPEAGSTGEKITYLFVQSYQSGSITPAEGQDGRYTVTLEQGLGSTIYFADRPSRDVGIAPTPQFLEGLGFSEDNPPNAALLVETASGETDIAVVELFNPTYDPTTQGVTYEIAVLENWEDSVELGFQQAPADLAALAPAFGTAHLLIDDCPDSALVTCYTGLFPNTEIVGNLGDHSLCWSWGGFDCEPCGLGWGGANAQCNQDFSACNGQCHADAS